MKKISGVILATVLVFPFATPGHALEKATAIQQQSLTYDQAVSMALSKSYTLKNAEADIERSYKVREKAADNVVLIPTGPGNSQANAAFTGLVKADLGWQMNKRQVKIEEDSLEYSVRKAYNAILQAQENKKLADSTVANEELQSNVIAYKVNAGLASKAEQVRAEGSYKSEKKNQKAADAALVSAYQSFNQLVGLSPSAKPQLVEKPVFKKLEEDNLEFHINHVIEENPQIWLANKNIDLARLNLDLYTFNDPKNPEPYDAKKIDVKKAENQYLDAKEKAAQAVRTIYYNIKELEERYEALQEQVPAAEEALRLAKVQYEVGTGTKAELSSAELKVRQLKQKLFEIEIKHDDLVNAYYKPWVLASSAGSTGS
jgi:outer membrane protein